MNLDAKDCLCNMIARHTGAKIDHFSEVTTLQELGLVGPDLEDFLRDYALEFGVDMTNYRWEHHSGVEGINPLWILWPPWWDRAERIPIDMKSLLDGIQHHRWMLQYPEPRISPKPDYATWIAVALTVLVLIIFLCVRL
jgi:hypothetical protein